MEARQPSRTAFGAALHRAAHQLLDSPLIFADPLALQIVGPDAEAALRAGQSRHTAPASAPMRALIVARSRYTEDSFAAAREHGVHQYVALGAGLDTFAYRQPADGQLAVYEVDHPATQAWKHAQLGAQQIAVDDHVRYAPVDFEAETLADGLQRVGFDFAAPAHFAWLGVVPYLTRAAAYATLRFVAGLPAGSAITFDYATQPPAADAQSRIFDLAHWAAAVGEPLRSFYAPEALARALSDMRFSEIADLDVDAINTRYFRNRKDGFRMRGHAHLLRAQV